MAAPSARDTTAAPGHTEEKSKPSAVGGLGSRTTIESPACTVKSGRSGPRFATTTVPFAVSVACSPARIVSEPPLPRTSPCPWPTPTFVPAAPTSASTRLLPSPVLATIAPPGTSTTTSSVVASSSTRPELARTSEPPSASPITKPTEPDETTMTCATPHVDRCAVRDLERIARRHGARAFDERLECGLALRLHAHPRAAHFDRDSSRGARVSNGGGGAAASTRSGRPESAEASTASRSTIAPPRETSNDLPGDRATPPSSVSMRAAPTVTSTRVELPSAEMSSLPPGSICASPIIVSTVSAASAASMLASPVSIASFGWRAPGLLARNRIVVSLETAMLPPFVRCRTAFACGPVLSPSPMASSAPSGAGCHFCCDDEVSRFTSPSCFFTSAT